MNSIHRGRLLTCGILLPALLTFGCATEQQTFLSPEIAVKSLVAAARTDDPSRFRPIFGSSADRMFQSGDEVADRNARRKFLEAFDQRHELVESDNGSLILLVGENNWPFPVPIVRKSQSEWMFDTEAGEGEIVARRVGRNEAAAVQVCRAIVEAQREYLVLDPDGNGTREYAQQFLSDEGKRNGLYWPTAPGEPPSPLGPLVAQAAAEGYATTRRPESGRSPYHGYYYRVLKSQGPNAPGGARDYLIGDRMIAGFAVLAYPVEFDRSGVMSFIVNHDGVVYQRNLGPGTAQAATTMTAYDPGPEWTKVE